MSDPVGGRVAPWTWAGCWRLLITYGYDNVDNLNLVTYPDKSPTTFTYDNDGRQQTMADSTGSHSWAYNWADQLTQLTTPQGTMGYEYDAWGRRNKLIEGSQNTVYTYQNDKLYTITKAGESVTATFLYDQYGRLVTKGANGVTTTYGYDALDRVNSIVHQNGNTTLHQETYNYDFASNLTSKVVNSVATFYTYDDIDQLTSENGGGIANSYTYDDNGNRLTKLSSGALTTYDYDGADKLLHAYLPGAVTRTYQYDNAGRTTVISGGGYNRTFTWNSDDRLTSLSGSNVPTTSYNYNAAGTRIWKSNANGSRTYKRDGVGVTAPVLSDSVSTMVPGISERHSGVNKTIATDRLGSTKALIASGAITDTSEFDAFGVAVSRTGTTNTQKGFVGRAGYQEDAESGYKLLGSRYYDAESGRFLTRDKVFSGRNWYAYCGNNPLAYIDPTGYEMGRAVGAVVGGIIGGVVGTIIAPGAGTVVGGGVGTAVGSFFGSLFDGDSAGVAAQNAALDGAVDVLASGLSKITKIYRIWKARKAGKVATVIVMEGGGAVAAPSIVEDIACGTSSVTPLPKGRIKAPPTKKGNAPIGDDGYPVELHHDGDVLVEMTRTEHRLGASFLKNHPLGRGEKPVDRSEFAKDRRKYWSDPRHYRW